MKMFELRTKAVLLGMTLCLACVNLVAAKRSFVTIGTGGVTGVYYPTGGALAKVINQGNKTHRIKASAESTAGSVYNINAVLNGDLELGIAQSDRQFQAIHGIKDWKKAGKAKKLRSICSFHTEIINLIAAEDAGIKSLKDLKGKHVNLGNPGSGNLGNAMDVLQSAGINPKKDLRPAYLKAAEAPKKLQDGQIDAFFYSVGHPNGSITEATNGKRKVRFVPVVGMKDLLKKYSFYTRSLIPINLYANVLNKKPVESIGLKATLVTSSSVSDPVIYQVTKSLFENLERFKKLHPALAGLTKKDMLQGLSAPLHKGALKYYKEVGLK